MDLNKKFKIFLIEKEITLKQFCELIGMSYTYISAIMNGRMFPGQNTIDLIEKLTDGKIRYRDFVKSENKKDLSKNQKHEKHHERQSDKKE